jgi:flagellar M-ring protein FliF
VATGIVAFVARSVEGLLPENVTLVDTNGHLLSDPHASESGSITTQMDYRREMESYLASKAEGMLAQVLGPGRAVVRVTADINFQRLREKKETYNPEGRVITSEVITSSKSSAANAAAARGAAGTASNLSKQPAAPGGTNTNAEESTKTDFAVSKITQEFEDKYGAVERLTIAAMIDLSADGAKGGGGAANFSLAEAQDIIKQAVGFKANRDEIKVSNVKLAPAVVPPVGDGETDQVQTWQNTISLVRNGSLGLAALVTLLLGWMVVRRLRLIVSTAASPARGNKEGVQTPLIVTALEQNPEVVAKVLANWLEQSDRQRRAAA